jgi:hypothetical protein
MPGGFSRQFRLQRLIVRFMIGTIIDNRFETQRSQSLYVRRIYLR